MLSIQEEKCKGSRVSKVEPLDILLEEISHRCLEKKAESQAVFVDHNFYCSGEIIDALFVREMCKDK